jgi:hypothetical protein
MISKSPARGTFQQESSKKKLLDPTKSEEERQSAIDLLELYSSWDATRNEQENDPKWQKNNLEYNLRSTGWILEKVRSSDKYAQNLYAAMCNRDFTKNDVWPILIEQKWSCSWRHAGGIIADMRQEGDYIDWYCSGIGDGLGNGDKTGEKGYVPEGVVTDEIREDLFKLGWIVLDDEDNLDV